MAIRMSQEAIAIRRDNDHIFNLQAAKAYFRVRGFDTKNHPWL
jgi:hypothetical protein